MKRICIFWYAVVFFVAIFQGCTPDDSQYTILRVFYPNSLTSADGAVLKSAAMSDTLIYIDVESATVSGGFTAVEEDILQYGHCWSLSKTPAINSDSTNCTKFGKIGIGEIKKFSSTITSLEHESVYYVRSYVKTDDGKVSYNPSILKISTPNPVNIWLNYGNFRIDGNMRMGMVSTTAVINGDTVVYCGLGGNSGEYFNDFYRFNQEDSSFVKLRDFPGEEGRCDASAFTVQYKKNGRDVIRVMVGLGYDSKGNCFDNFYEYNPLTDTWQSKDYKFNGGARCGASAFAIGKFGYVGLGHKTRENTSAACNDFYIWYVDDNDFFNQSPVTFSGSNRSGAASFVVNGAAYVCGGLDEDGDALKDCYRFVPGNNADDYGQWQQVADLPVERGFAASFVVGDFGFVGTGENSSGLLSDFYKYNPINDTWLKCNDYKNGKYQTDPSAVKSTISPAVTHALGFSTGDRGFVGGGNSVSGAMSYFWCYRP